MRVARYVLSGRPATLPASAPGPGRAPARVLHVVDSMGAGGAELLLAQLAGVAGEAGITMRVAYLSEGSGTPAADRLREHGVEPVLVPVRHLGLPAILALRRHIAAVGPDVVHTHLGTSDFVGGFAARSLGVPAVSTLHQMVWERRGRDGVKERLFALGRRVGMRRVVAVSDSARLGYLATGWERPERVVTILNGIADAAQPGTGRAVREELGIPADARVVGVLAAMRPEKGHDAAARTVARLRERDPGLRLLVVGDGPARAEVEAAMAPLGEAALLTGYRADVMRVLDAVDVLLHPPTADALPTALIEAMAASVPIVATDVGGIPEIVEDGRSGVLVPGPATPESLARAVGEVLGSAELRARLAAGGRARFDAVFSAAVWAGRLRELYDDVLVPA